MRWNLVVAAVLAGGLTGCATLVHSNYRPGTTVRATVGSPLVEVLDLSLPATSLVGERQLVYGGRSGDTIKLTYREFGRGRRIEPVLTQDVQFDLSRSSRITFQEMRLEVVEATAEWVVATVLPAAYRGRILEPVEAPREVTPPRPIQGCVTEGVYCSGRLPEP